MYTAHCEQATGSNQARLVSQRVTNASSLAATGRSVPHAAIPITGPGLRIADPKWRRGEAVEAMGTAPSANYAILPRAAHSGQ